MRICQWFAFSAVLLIASTIAVCQAAEGSFDRTLTVSGPVDMQVQTGSGSIEVRSGNSSSVAIHGRIRASGGWFSGNVDERIREIEKNPPIEQNGNTIRIGRNQDSGLFNNISISYEITVPADTRLDSKTGSGTQNVNGIKGPVRASAGSGSIHVHDVGSETQVSSGSGGLELENVKGDLRASAGSGTIQAHNIAGAFHASTGSGDITLEQNGSGDVEAKAGSGTLHLENVNGSLHASTGSGSVRATGNPRGSWDLRSGSGSVDVKVPSNAAFDIYAHSSSGSINVDFPVTVQGSMSRKEVRGSVRGGGGFNLNIETSSGSIRVGS